MLFLLALSDSKEFVNCIMVALHLLVVGLTVLCCKFELGGASLASTSCKLIDTVFSLEIAF